MDERRLRKILESVDAHLQQRTKTVDGATHPFYEFRPQPTQRGQIPFMSSEATIQILWGGNRAGKTLCADQKQRIIQVAFDPANPSKKFKAPTRQWYCCRPGVLREWFKKYVQGLPPDMVEQVWWGSGKEEVLTKNGSSLKMKSFEQDIQDFQGEAVDVVRWDERGPHDIWVECFTRIVSTHGKMILSFTPIGIGTEMDRIVRGMDPKYENLQDGPFAHFRVNPRDNPTIAPDMLLAMEEEIGSNEVMRRIRIDGDYILLSGTRMFEGVVPQLHAQQQVPTLDLTFSAELEPRWSSWKKDSRGWKVWERPIPFASYVIGADPAKGVGGDFSAAHILSADTGIVAASFSSNEINPWDFGCELRLAATTYNKALIAPEINQEGSAVLEAIRQYGYNRIYKRKSYGGRTRQVGNDDGWMTGKYNKEPAIRALSVALKAGLEGKPGGVTLYNAATIGQLHEFSYLNETRPGSFGMGALSGHDDDVMALAIAVMALEQAPVQSRRVGRGAVSRSYMDEWRNEVLREGLRSRAEQLSTFED